MSSRRPKVEGLIEAPKGTMNTLRYKLTSGGKSSILTVYETANSFTFYLGGYRIYCVDAQIMKLNEDTFIDEGLLTKVRYDVQCGTLRPENEAIASVKEGKFEKGKDTSMILNLMMTYIKDKYPQVKTMRFNDLSTKTCDNGASVSLSAMKLFIDGQSWYLPNLEDQESMPSTGECIARGWYQDHFGAKLYPGSESLFRNMIEEANTKKDKMSWEQFYTSFISKTTLPMKKEEMESIYIKCKTWQEFFKTIRDSIGISKLCIWFSQNSWFELIFLSYMKYYILDFKFILTLEDFSQEYTIEPFTAVCLE